MIPFRAYVVAAVCALAMAGGSVRAQMGSVGLSAGSSGSTASGTQITVTGRVMNAASGQPVPRALVRLNDRAVLADHEGKFEFSQFSVAGTNLIQVQKPGFYASADAGGVSQRRVPAAKLGAPIEVRMYPEALLTGTVTAPDESALAGIQVMAMREQFDEVTGGERWLPAGQSISNAKGEFRIACQAGSYRLETRMRIRGQEGESVLPLSFPQDSEGETSGSVHVAPGAEEHFDLKPQVSRTYGVTMRVDGLGGPGFPMILARMGNGPVMPVGGFRQGGPGETRVELPVGSFTLTAAYNDRVMEYGETRVTVTDHDVTGVELHMAPVAPIPVEVVVDSGATSDKTPPTAMQLGLIFRGTEAGIFGIGAQAGVQQARDGTASVRLSPGSYRLYTARNSGQWYVKEARYGTTDLLMTPMTVAAGGGSGSIVVTVSDQTGSLSGTVTLNGEPAECALYVVPAGAGAVMPARSGSDGRYNLPSLAPGTYRVAALEERHSLDLRDPKVLDGLSAHVGTVTVTAGGKAVLDLSAAPETEVKP